MLFLVLYTSDITARKPYGKIHQLAHETIDNFDLDGEALHVLHNSIHHAFSSSYSPDVCYPQFAREHTGCLKE
jgi:hypothetical protein